MTDPNTRWTELFLLVATKFGQIEVFRQLTKRGVADTQNYQHLTSQNDAFVQMLESADDNDPGSIFVDGDERAQILAELTQSQIAAAGAAVDAASLVFAHSVVDAIVSDALNLVAHLAPETWEPYLEDRKVTLKKAKELQFANLYQELVSEEVEDLCRGPLTKRIDVINQRCKPLRPVVLEGRRIQYDGNRLKRLDRLRHDIIHKVQTDNALPNIDDDVLFLKDVCLHVLSVVRSKFDLSVKLPARPVISETDAQEDDLPPQDE